MTVREIREKINLVIYDSKVTVLRILSLFYVLVSLSSVVILIYYFGFPLTLAQKAICFQILQYTLGFYIFRFLAKIFYTFDPKQFLKDNWFEAIIMILLILEGVSYNIFGVLILSPVAKLIGIQDFTEFSLIFIQIYVFLVVIQNLLKQSKFRPWLNIHPGWLFTISISLMVIVGTFLLMLPEMTLTEGSLSFTDSLFTSMSSVSVTGLSTIDITETLSRKGQVVVMLLMQFGGLNTIAFGALILVIAKFGVGIKYHEVIEDFVNRDSILKTDSMLSKIVIWVLFIEVFGAILMYMSFGNEGIFADHGDKVFYTLFHTVSAFNNGGLSIFEGGMMHPEVINNHGLHVIFMMLIFCGGFGMIYLFEIFEYRKIKERIVHPWRTIDFGTKISLYFTIGLLVAGALIFYMFEYNNTLSHNSAFGDVVTSFFQSLTTRNAGFNLVDTASLSTPVIIFFLFLMFIGASSGSAGGGIRTSTFAILCAAIISVIKGKKHTELFQRTISNDLVLKSFAIFLFFVAGNVIGPFLLAFTEADLLASGKFTFKDIIFEHVSAASTVGLSTGITSELSSAGKYILIAAMFIGRVGTLTLAYLVSKRVLSTNYKYPEAHTMIG